MDRNGLVLADGSADARGEYTGFISLPRWRVKAGLPVPGMARFHLDPPFVRMIFLSSESILAAADMSGMR